MKRFLFLVFALAIMFFSFSRIYAETTTQEKVGLNKEQTEQLKDQLSGLKQVFGIEDEKQVQSVQGQQEQSQSKKNIADVADRALDMVNKMVTDTAATLNKVAPDVWRIMMKQQYAYAITKLIAPWSCLLVALIFLSVMRKKWAKPPLKITRTVKLSGGGEEEKEEYNEAVAWHLFITTICPIALMVLFAFWGISRLTDSVPMLINPEFYAIKNLILILLGK